MITVTYFNNQINTCEPFAEIKDRDNILTPILKTSGLQQIYYDDDYEVY